jgi:hypothetical protein
MRGRTVLRARVEALLKPHGISTFMLQGGPRTRRLSYVREEVNFALHAAGYDDKAIGDVIGRTIEAVRKQRLNPKRGKPIIDYRNSLLRGGNRQRRMKPGAAELVIRAAYGVYSRGDRHRDE